MKNLTIILILISQLSVAQGLFESGGDESSKLSYELNGYVRGAYFVGESIKQKDVLTTQSAYGETAMRLKVKKSGFGEAFSDIRFLSGYEYDKKNTYLNVREAYVKYYAGNVSISMGKQIIVWGRADGYNPTNMLSLQDMLSRSANEDDKRFGNWMLTTSYRVGVFNFEGVWIPVYESWRIPFDIMGQKFSTPFNQPNYPNFDIKNSSYALRINMLGSKIDGSISYFGGYNPKPAIDGELKNSIPNIQPTTYKINMVGADFQTTIGKFGLRGEFAYTQPISNSEFEYLPNSDLQWVIGSDRTWGNFMVNVQYLGRWVANFKQLEQPNDLSKMFSYILEKQNRMFNSQQHNATHSFSTRLSQKLFQETLDISAFGMYNITTKEFMIRPKISYFITDDMDLSVGMEYFYGDDETLYGLIGDIINTGFLELKITF